MKILIIGGYACGNPGDEAILKATVYRLTELFPSATVGIWTDKPEYKVVFDRPVAHHLVCWKPMPWKNHESFWSRALIKLYTDGYPWSKKIVHLFRQFDKRNLKYLAGYDKYLFIGGGYINSDHCLIEMNYLASEIKSIGKPIHLLSQTLGPFKKVRHRRMAEEIFKHAKTIGLRDEQSAEEASKHHHKIWFDVDDALLLEPRITDADKLAVDSYFKTSGEQCLHIGINLRDWSGSRESYRVIANSLKSFVRLHDSFRIKFIFIPMETSSYCDDRIESVEFQKYLDDSVDFALPREILKMEQTFYLISRLDLMIGMRFHSLVFAFANAVPTIGLYKGMYYFRKLSGLFKAFDMADNMLPDYGLERLEPLMHQMLRHPKAIRDTLIRRKKRIAKNKKCLLSEIIRPRKQSVLQQTEQIKSLNKVDAVSKTRTSAVPS